jgi:hypothetical protein
MSDDVPGGTPPADDPETPQPEPELEEDELPDEELADEQDLLDEEPEPQPQAATPPRKGSQRVQNLVNENRQQKARLDQLTQQVQQLLGTQRQPSQAEIAEAQRQRRAHLESLDPISAAEFVAQENLSQVQRLVQQAVAPIYAQNEQAEYEREFEKNPKLRAAFADEVEALKRQFPGVTKRQLLAYALGERALQNQGRLTTRAARNGAAGAAQHTTTPTGTRADVNAPRGRRADDVDERLRGVQI